MKIIFSIGYSDSGWTDREFAAFWIETVFIPAAIDAAEDPSKPILLIIDGHDSHECAAIKKAVYENQRDHKFILFCFPSKCTHKLQPLDVGIFNQTQAVWKDHVEELTDKNIQITQYNVVHEYMALRDKFMKTDWIQSAFKKTGISPFNPDIFTEEDFAPSQSFSTKAHVPSAYPEAVPSSDPAIPTDCEYSGSSDSEWMESGSSDSEWVESGDENNAESQSFTYQPNSVSTDSESSDNEEPAIQPQPALPLTCSAMSSSSDFLFQPIPRDKLQTLSKEDLVSYTLNLQSHIRMMQHQAQMTDTLHQSANAHCTLAVRMIADINVRLDNANKKRNRGTVKKKARVVVAPKLEELFAQEEREAEIWEKEAKEKERAKAVEEVERNHCIQEAISSKIYNLPLSSYKRKEDLVGLAGALEILATGTVTELTERIKEHLSNNQNLAEHARFSTLFHSRRQHQRSQLPFPPQPMPSTSTNPMVAQPELPPLLYSFRC